MCLLLLDSLILSPILCEAQHTPLCLDRRYFSFFCLSSLCFRLPFLSQSLQENILFELFCYNNRRERQTFFWRELELGLGWETGERKKIQANFWYIFLTRGFGLWGKVWGSRVFILLEVVMLERYKTNLDILVTYFEL